MGPGSHAFYENTTLLCDAEMLDKEVRRFQMEGQDLRHHVTKPFSYKFNPLSRSRSLLTEAEKNGRSKIKMEAVKNGRSKTVE